MLLGKLLLQMTAVLMAVLPAILDYTWHDKRTVKFKRTRLALYLLCFFALIVSAVVTVQDERMNERQVQELTTRLDDLRRQSEAAAKKNESAAAEQSSQMQLLITGNQKLQETLAPFEAVAKQRYPTLQTESALKKLQSDLTGLQSRTSLLEEKSHADERAKVLLDEQKKTPPKLSVDLVMGGGRVAKVLIKSHTLVPFEFQWRIVTRNNVIVSGIPLNWTKVYPSAERNTFNQQEEIDLSRIVDNYLELRLNYRSIYAGETNLPALSGYITRKYRLSDDKRSLTGTDN